MELPEVPADLADEILEDMAVRQASPMLAISGAIAVPFPDETESPVEIAPSLKNQEKPKRFKNKKGQTRETSVSRPLRCLSSKNMTLSQKRQAAKKTFQQNLSNLGFSTMSKKID